MNWFKKLINDVKSWMQDQKAKNDLYKEAYKQQELKEISKKAKRDAKEKYANKPSKSEDNPFSSENINKRLFG